MSGKQGELGQASRMAEGAFGEAPLDGTPTPCGEDGNREAAGNEDHWLEVVLVGGEDQPIAGARFQLDTGDGNPEEHRLGDDGRCRVEGLPPGRHQVSFPDLDASAWELRDGPTAPRVDGPPNTATTPHTVGAAECLASIAAQHGFTHAWLWGHRSNGALRNARRSPFVLAPGDVVQIPALRLGLVDVDADAQHTFRRKSALATIRLRLQSRGKPLVDCPYTLECGPQVLRGRTNIRGAVEIEVPPNVPPGLLRVGEGDTLRTYRVIPRALDPMTEDSGVRSRLSNLGYSEDGRPLDDAAATTALRRFQQDHRLPINGLDDAETKAALFDAHLGQL
ncbi:MAG: peptidoglycan-binding domain-containing protein [Myxococcota bacterium]